MSFSDFQHLCAGFCEIARVAAPALQAEPDGDVAFHVEWRGVVVDLMFRPAASGDHAFVIFDLGTTDAGGVDPGRIHLALLEANFLLLRVNPPTFSCHPKTRHAMLQCTYPLLESAPGGLFALIEEGVKLALEWRKTFFLHEEPTVAPASLSQEPTPNRSFV